MTDITLDLSKETQRFVKKLARLEQTDVLRGLERFLDRQGGRVAGHITSKFLSGQRLSRRTGTLARSIQGRSVRVGGVPALKVGIFRGPAVQYARIQEEGGTIRPKSAKALAIPVEGGPALTRAGVERYGGPRNFPGELKFIPFRGSGLTVGGLFATDRQQGRDESGRYTSDFRSVLQRGGQRRDKRGRYARGRALVPVYWLVKQVTIKGKHYLRDGLLEMLPEISRDLELYLRDLVEKGESNFDPRARRRRDAVTGRFIR